MRRPSTQNSQNSFAACRKCAGPAREFDQRASVRASNAPARHAEFEDVVFCVQESLGRSTQNHVIDYPACFIRTGPARGFAKIALSRASNAPVKHAKSRYRLFCVLYMYRPGTQNSQNSFAACFGPPAHVARMLR